MGLFLILALIILGFFLFDYLQHAPKVGETIFAILILEILMFFVFGFVSAIIDGFNYKSSYEYIEITPQNSIYYKKIDNINFLVNIQGKDTLITNVEFNTNIKIPRIKVEIRKKEKSFWYFSLNKSKKYYYLEIPAVAYLIPEIFYTSQCEEIK